MTNARVVLNAGRPFFTFALRYYICILCDMLGLHLIGDPFYNTISFTICVFCSEIIDHSISLLLEVDTNIFFRFFGSRRVNNDSVITVARST
jgi:hypothetical protein